MAGLWVSTTEYVEFSEAPDRDKLQQEIATRQAAWDWSGFMGLLPDPDPILRKLGDGSEILESLLADGHLIGITQQRKLGTLKKEFRWAPGLAPGETKASRRATQLRDNLAADLENVDLYNLVSALLDAPFYGNTPVEIKWAPSDDYSRLAIKDLEAKPTSWFSFNDKNDPRFVSLQSPWDGLECPFGKFVFCRHFPTYVNPFGLRLLSRCFWPVAFKKGGIKFWAVLAEKYGIPFLIGKHRVGATPAEKQEMLSNLTRMVRDAVAVIAQGGAVELVETGKGGSDGNIHSGLVHEMNAEMSKVIMCQTLTAEVSDQGGSRAQGTVHEDILEDVRQADQTLVKKTMEEIAWLYMLVNAPGIPAPKFIWFEEDDPKKETAERDKTLKETGVKFSKSYYVRQYGLQEDDFELEAAKPADQPGKPAAEFAASAGKGFPDQTAIDAMIKMVTPEMMHKQISAVIKPVIEGLQQTGNPDNAMQALLAAFPDMDAAALDKMLSNLMFIAEAIGRASVSGEE
jgi:phage gp29-like protein